MRRLEPDRTSPAPTRRRSASTGRMTGNDAIGLERIRALQRSAGNAAVSRALAGRSDLALAGRSDLALQRMVTTETDSDDDTESVYYAAVQEQPPTPAASVRDVAAVVRVAELVVEAAVAAETGNRTPSPVPSMSDQPEVVAAATVLVEATAERSRRTPTPSPSSSEEDLAGMVRVVEAVVRALEDQENSTSESESPAPPGVVPETDGLEPPAVVPEPETPVVGDVRAGAAPTGAGPTDVPATGSRLPRYLTGEYWDGDPAKALGNLAAAGGPILQSVGAFVSGAGGATYAGTGLSGLAAGGDLVSEILKYRDNKGLNLGKAIGGGTGVAGAALTAAGQATGIPALRGVGYGTQTLAQLIKAVGEGKKLEEMGWPLGRRPAGDEEAGPAPARERTSAADVFTRRFWDGDPAKGVGNLLAAGAPTLQSVGALQPGAGGAMYAGTGLWGLSAAGDMVSEIRNYRADKGVNLGKLGGGALGLTGAALTAAGQGTGIASLRAVGFGTQVVGRLIKSVGEGRKLEKVALPSWLTRLVTLKPQGPTA